MLYFELSQLRRAASMGPLLLICPPPFFATTRRSPSVQTIAGRNPRFRIRCSPVRSPEVEPKSVYRMGFFDHLLMDFFRKKMVEVVGMDSEKPGYDGLMEVVNNLMEMGKGNLDAQQSSVRVLISLFPSWLLYLYKKLITPIGGGKAAAMMLARATALSCQWLMGPCSVNNINLPDGSWCNSGVFVERCKYLEESKCVGICINTCKIPTQTFFKDFMGVPLYMEPNFDDYSCQFNFGIMPLPSDSDKALQEPCLAICPNAKRRRELSNREIKQCPKA